MPESSFWNYCAFWLGLLPVTGLTAEPADPLFAKVAVPFLKTHCFECHGAETQESRIRYDQISAFDPPDRHLWTMVHQQVSCDAMPPAGLPRPNDAERKQFLD